MIKQGKTKKEVYALRLTPKDKEKLLRDAEAAGMNPSAYVRFLIKGSQIKQYPEMRRYIVQLINEVNRIGTNINQIVKNNNSELYSDTDKRELRAYMQKLNLLLKEAVEYGNQ